MRVTIDLEREIIIVPDNFFKRIDEDNERLKKFGATPVKAVERIKRAFNTAIKDTDKRLVTQSNAKTARAKKAMTPEEAKKILEETAGKK